MNRTEETIQKAARAGTLQYGASQLKGSYTPLEKVPPITAFDESGSALEIENPSFVHMDGLRDGYATLIADDFTYMGTKYYPYMMYITINGEDEEVRYQGPYQIEALELAKIEEIWVGYKPYPTDTTSLYLMDGFEEESDAGIQELDFGDAYAEKRGETQYVIKVPAGDEVTITAVPREGYAVKGYYAYDQQNDEWVELANGPVYTGKISSETFFGNQNFFLIWEMEQ